MSTESRTAAFDHLGKDCGTSKLLNQILDEIYKPQVAFTVPPLGMDLTLSETKGTPTIQILSEVQTKIIAHAINNRHIWSLAHMVPPAATISVIADLLIGAMNQCAFIWEEAPLAAALELEAVSWLARRVGFGEGASGLLTSGGTMSNCIATYLALARANKLLTQDRERYCVIVSDQGHFSVQKAAVLNGLHSSSIIHVKTDSQGRLRQGQISEATTQARNGGRVPVLFICTAGTTNAGILEPADEFLTAARSCGAWCHIDAAHGGLMCLSRQRHASTLNWADADSVSWDPHKSLYVSYAIGALLLKDSMMRGPLEFHSDYAIKEGDNGIDAGAWHLDGSRRFEALKLWMTIKYFGIEGFAEIVDHSLALAKEFAAHLRSLEEFVVLAEPDTNIVCFRFVTPDLDNVTLDNINIRIQRQLFQNGGPLISTTRIVGRIVLRAVLLNPLLEISKLAAIVESISVEAHRQASLARRMAGGPVEDFTRYKSAS